MSGKLFWGFVAVELAVAGVIGWKIANAQQHPWAVPPQRPRPPGRRRRNPDPRCAVRTGTSQDIHCDVYGTADHPMSPEHPRWRGARQRAGNPISHANAVRGSFTTRRSS